MFSVKFAEKSDKNSTPGENQIKNTELRALDSSLLSAGFPSDVSRNITV